MPRIIKRAGVLALTAFLATTCVLAQDYEIKLVRPTKAGAKYRVWSLGTAKQSMAVVVSGQTIETREEKFRVELDAQVEVLAVDAKGRESKLAYTIEKCVKETDTARVELARPGQTLVIEVKDGKTVFQLDGAELPEDAKEALDVVVDMGTHEGGADDDDVFGTKNRQKIGDSWGINKDAVIKDLLKHKFLAQSENISGSVKLVGLAKLDDMDCLNITAEVTVKNGTPPAPPGYAVEKGEFTATFFGAFPLDLTIGRPAESAKMTMAMVLKPPAGQQPQDTEIHVTTERTAEWKRKFPKKN